ncbi:MAG: T9SS type A sorting domain-containing protein, partial [Sphingobacteriales bacterium]
IGVYAALLTYARASGLTEGAVYDWRVQATCASGSGAFVPAQFTTTSPATCNAPVGLSASAVTSSSATVSWAAVSGAASYDVDYKVGSSSTWINAVTGTTATSRTIAGLTASSTYDWRVSSNCTNGLTSADAASQFTTTAASTCPGTYDVSTNGTASGAALIPFNTDIKGLISPTGDVDFYRFVVSTGGTATVTLTTLPADYDLQLLSSNGTSQLALSQNGGTTGETITRTYTAGTYYLRVYGYNGANSSTVCYTLKVQLGTASREAGEGLITLTAGKLAVVPNPVGYAANLQFMSKTTGNADVSISNQTGGIVLRQILAVQAGANTRKLDVGKLANGLYYLKVQIGSEVQITKIVINK